ncbi:MAG: cupin domain-containing protein [candidate division Zixibacteria bacterium]|jgi:quercetin dioxygenase-like cupin family protein|nr:cupin domain-containing protein [candidate division Zixibacteria bacterium]
MPRTAFVTPLPKDADKYVRLIKPDDSVRFHSGYVTLQPGESVGEHSTQGNEEIIVVLQGEGEARAESIPSPLSFRAPAIVYMPPHTIHNMTNTGAEPLRYVFTVAPVE